jgi:propionyl-CoA synthetase
MEEAILADPDVAECAVVAVPDEIKGHVPLALVTLKAQSEAGPELAAKLVGRVRATIGPVAALKTVLVVERLPKTRSGKVLRGPIRQIAEGKRPSVPPTIEAPESIDEIAAVMGSVGIVRRWVEPVSGSAGST